MSKDKIMGLPVWGFILMVILCIGTLIKSLNPPNPDAQKLDKRAVDNYFYGHKK